MPKKTVTVPPARSRATAARPRTNATVPAPARGRGAHVAPASAARGKQATALVGVVMGSRSDWSVMQHAAEMLAELGIPFEARIVSAHRTPDELFAYAEQAAARGLRLIIAGAGGSAHLPGMLAAKTALPVLGVPVPTRRLQGLDSLLSIVQMPKGVPVATFAIGEAGAANAALFAAASIAHDVPAVATALARFRERQTAQVRAMKLPRVS